MATPPAQAPDRTRTILIFANPIAGRGAGSRIANALENQFQREGYRIFKSLDRPSAIPPEQLPEDAHAIIVIGGDGTLRGVAERLVETNRLAPLLPVPLGTANLMGRHLGISWEGPDVVRQISHAIAQHRVRKLDAGRVNGRLFLLMAGIGFDAKIVYHLDRMRNGPIRLWDYLIPTGLSLTAEPGCPMRVLLDGAEIFNGPRALGFVGNLSEYGTGFPVLPYARADDGLLDVCILPCESRVELVHLFLLAAAGEHVTAEGVIYRRGKHVRIESPEPVPVQADGDPAGFTPVDIDLLPVQVPFIVP